MTDKHSYSFFGQNSGLVLISSSKSDSIIFLRCFKRKGNGSWEKSSKGEGIAIKCVLEEIVMILKVLECEIMEWHKIHSYGTKKTKISFEWENDLMKGLWINVGKYSIMLNSAQVEIFKILLTHILKEKIIYGTTVNINILKNKNNLNKNVLQNAIENYKSARECENPVSNFSDLIINQDFKDAITHHQPKEINILTSNTNKNILRDMSSINGSISGETEKALLISFDSGKKIWIPKSTIHCQYLPQKHIVQSFLIDNWILKRNKVGT
jgi:hypothetical protein